MRAACRREPQDVGRLQRGMSTGPPDALLHRRLAARIVEDARAADIAVTPARAARVDAWISVVLERCHDELFARRFQGWCPVPGVPTDAFLHRLLPAPQGGRMIAGIRFKGGDLGHPFVDLVAWERPLDGAAGAALPRILAAAFAGFSPLAMRLRWPGTARPPLAPDGLEVDQHVLAAELSVLAAQPRPWGELAVDVRPARDLSWLPVLHAAFAGWRAQIGPRGDEVCVADRDDLQACLDTGAVVCAWSGGHWAGVAAARRGEERLAGGYEMVELFMGRALRGQRRAAVLQRRLVDTLVDHGRDELYGTVHGTNAPSLRTARRVGRRVVETWWMAPLPR